MIRMRIVKDRSVYSRVPWRVRCACMTAAGYEFKRTTWAEAAATAQAHWNSWHRGEFA